MSLKKIINQLKLQLTLEFEEGFKDEEIECYNSHRIEEFPDKMNDKEINQMLTIKGWEVKCEEINRDFIHEVVGYIYYFLKCRK